MRLIVLGAGAIGASIGARAFQHGHDVVLVARGEHFRAIRDNGLRLESPDGAIVVPVPVVDRVERVDPGAGDVVLLAVKSQDTLTALDPLTRGIGRGVSIVCAQNGVANEAMALRFFAHVYGVVVMSPTAYLAPGVVQVYSAPVTGVLDVGRYPRGIDDTVRRLCDLFGSSTYRSQPLEDVMAWKYGKLLSNLSNAVEAVCGPGTRQGPVAARAVEEARECFEAARIAVADDGGSRQALITPGVIGSAARPGGSVVQSLLRATGSAEVDYLNGEIVRLGRELGIATPVNEALQRVVAMMAAQRRPPGLMSEKELLALAGRAG